MPIQDIRKNTPDADGALPPCQEYISIETPMCGEPAQWQVLVKNQVANAMVDLCNEHKVKHEQRLRALRKRLAAQSRVRK